VVLIVDRMRENVLRQLGLVLKREEVIGSECDKGIGDGR